MKTPTLYVAVEGGIVQSIASNDPKLVGLRVFVVDYDTEGNDECELVQVRQQDNEFSEALVTLDEVTPATISIPELD
jgi:hypothetical protein